MFNKLDTERSFNVIDDILAETAVKNAESGDLVLKVRTAYDKNYTASDTDDPAAEYDYSDIDYADQSDEGYVGLPIAPKN